MKLYSEREEYTKEIARRAIIDCVTYFTGQQTKYWRYGRKEQEGKRGEAILDRDVKSASSIGSANHFRNCVRMGREGDWGKHGSYQFGRESVSAEIVFVSPC